MGGMSEDEARTAVTQYRDEYLRRTVEVDVNGKTVSATLEQLGYNCEIGDVVAKSNAELERKGIRLPIMQKSGRLLQLHLYIN